MINLLIIGSSGHAKVAIEIAEECGFNIVGLIDSYRNVGDITLGYKVLGDISDINRLKTEMNIDSIFIGIGDNHSRKVVYNKLQELNVDLFYTKLIHPSAIISKYSKIHNGTIVMAGAVINVDATIGEFSVINTNSSIDHDCSIGDFTSISPGCTLGGSVKIGNDTFIGIGSTIKHKIEIGSNCLVGAGSTVVSNVDNGVVCYGVPAKFIRYKQSNEKFL